MPTHGLSSALTLYDARTLSLSQAASQAGLTELAFRAQLQRHGIEIWDRHAEAGREAESRMITAD